MSDSEGGAVSHARRKGGFRAVWGFMISRVQMKKHLLPIAKGRAVASKHDWQSVRMVVGVNCVSESVNGSSFG